MKDMNSVYMSTCMKALCRHVKQNKLQGEQGNRGTGVAKVYQGTIQRGMITTDKPFKGIQPFRLGGGGNHQGTIQAE